MVLWRDRHMIYKVGFCGLVLSIVAYVISFSLPYWALLHLQSYGYLDQSVGLWQACLHATLSCRSNVYENNPPWLNAARALCCMSLIFYVISLGNGYYRNVSRRGQASENKGRLVESSAIVATVVGAIGCAIFAAEFHRIYIKETGVGRLYWAFGAVTSALCVAGFSACAMFAFNRGSGRRNRRRCRSPRAAGATTATLRGRGPNGQSYSMHIQFPAGLDDGERLHIPYFGDVSPDQLVYGATPLQPPAYEAVVLAAGGSTTAAAAGGAGRVQQFPLMSYVNAASGSGAVSASSAAANVGLEAPPPYEEISKDCVLTLAGVAVQLQPSDASAAPFSPAAATAADKDKDKDGHGQDNGSGNRG